MLSIYKIKLHSDTDIKAIVDVNKNRDINTSMHENVRGFPTSQTCFMDLAAEIRLQIYSYLVRPGDRLLIEDTRLDQKKDHQESATTSCYPFRQLSSRILSPWTMATYAISHADGYRRSGYGGRPRLFANVLLLNRKIRDEVLDYLYGQHLQFNCSPDGVEAFLNDRTANTLRHVTNITILVPSETGRTKFKSVCKLIAEKLQLTRLAVQLNTFMWEDQPLERVQDANGSAKDLLELDWVKSLLQIQNLKSFKIQFGGRYALDKPNVGDDLTRMLRERMVSNS